MTPVNNRIEIGHSDDSERVFFFACEPKLIRATVFRLIRDLSKSPIVATASAAGRLDFWDISFEKSRRRAAQKKKLQKRSSLLSGRFNSSVGSSTAAAIAKKALPSCLQLVLTHHAEARQGYFSFRQNANAQDNKRSAGSRSMRKDDQPPALLRVEDAQLRIPVPTNRA